MDTRVISFSSPNNKEIYNRYISEVRNLKPLSREEEVDLFKRIEVTNDKAAIDKICKHNLLFVVSIAKKYSSLVSSTTLTLEDLISEGNIGLYLAIEKFDYKKGFHFISYAVWGIRRAILNAIQLHIRSIKLPNSVREKVHNLHKKELEMQQTLGRDIDVVELYNAILEDGSITEFNTLEKIESYINMSKSDISLSNLIGGSESDNKTQLIELLKTDNIAPDVQLLKKEYNERIRQMVSNTPRNGSPYLIDYFGLFGNPELSVTEMADKYGVSTSRIRARVFSYLRIMRHKNIKSRFFFERG